MKMDANVQTSINGGNTFTATFPTPPSNVFTGWAGVIAVTPADENVLIWGCASLAVSTDGGSTWTGKGVHSDQHVAVFAPSNSNIVYFANDGGVCGPRIRARPSSRSVMASSSRSSITSDSGVRTATCW